MFKEILNYIQSKYIVHLGELAKVLNKDYSIILDAITLLLEKGYLTNQNQNCKILDENIKFMCFGCPQKKSYHAGMLNTYRITPKAIQYLKTS